MTVESFFIIFIEIINIVLFSNDDGKKSKSLFEHSFIHRKENKMLNSTECRFSRLFASILLIFSLISLVVNLYAIRIVRTTSKISIRNRILLLSIFISSLFVIVLSVPPVVVQFFLCFPIRSSFICQIEGFNSFFNGCLSMYILVALSMVHYISTTRSSFLIELQRKFETSQLILVIFCFVFSGIWSIPPLFGRFSTYVPQGLGFHCGLNWFDRSLTGRIYFLFLFVFVYLFPLLIVICINLSIQRTVYRLTHLHSIISLERNRFFNEDRFRRHVSQRFHQEEIQRLQCLNEDQRFILITEINIFTYLFAWTPYSFVALGQIFGLEIFITNRYLMTTCAILAKLSIIFNPILYTILLKKCRTNGQTLTRTIG